MSESVCTNFTKNPFKPTHCKLCLKPQTEHKRAYEVFGSSLNKKEETSSKPESLEPKHTVPVVKTREWEPPKADPVESSSSDSKPPEEQSVTRKPVNAFKTQLEQQMKQTEPKPADTKPARVYKYQTNPQPVAPVQHSGPYHSIYARPDEEVRTESNTEHADDQPKQIAPKKVPVGGMKMQGFDPSMLVNEALKRRQKKNLDDGALEEAHGTAVVKVEEPIEEPIPTNPNYRVGPGLAMIGGAGLTAALQKRKEKVAASTGEAIEEEPIETKTENESFPQGGRMEEVLRRIDDVPHELTPENYSSPSQDQYQDAPVTL